MGYFRFQKRIKLFPGARINLSKGLPSISIGAHGLTANLSTRRGLTTTASIRGTGLSYRHTWHGQKKPPHHHTPQIASSIDAAVVLLYIIPLALLLCALFDWLRLAYSFITTVLLK
jgi:hypothetical protein